MVDDVIWEEDEVEGDIDAEIADEDEDDEMHDG